MAKNEVFKYADWVSLPVTDGTPSGSPVVVGGFSGVAQTAEGEGGNVEGYASVALTGGWRVETADAVAEVGDPIYIGSDYTLTTVSTGNSLFGHALETKAAGAGTIAVAVVGQNNGAEA